jgi:hypothetical protein
MSVGYGHNFISQDAVFGSVTNFFKRLVLYGHFPYHYYNNLVMEGLGADTKILVSIRSLPDIVVSYKEHVDKSNYGPLDYRINGLPECNAQWSKFDDKDKYDYIIKFIVPWYIRFAVGWMEGAKKWPLRFVTFEEQTLYPHDFMMNVNSFLQIAVGPLELKEKLNPESLSKLSYNVGIIGRGYKLLDQDQLTRIKELVSCFGYSFLGSNLGKYLLYGYDGLPFEVADVIRNNAQGASLDPFSSNHMNQGT